MYSKLICLAVVGCLLVVNAEPELEGYRSSKKYGGYGGRKHYSPYKSYGNYGGYGGYGHGNSYGNNQYKPAHPKEPVEEYKPNYKPAVCKAPEFPQCANLSDISDDPNDPNYAVCGTQTLFDFLQMNRVDLFNSTTSDASKFRVATDNVGLLMQEPTYMDDKGTAERFLVCCPCGKRVWASFPNGDAGANNLATESFIQCCQGTWAWKANMGAGSSNIYAVGCASTCAAAKYEPHHY